MMFMYYKVFMYIFNQYFISIYIVICLSLILYLEWPAVGGVFVEYYKKTKTKKNTKSYTAEYIYYMSI